MVFFFFQAEDGIRDKLVTGVQTCALPISDAGRVALSAFPGAPVILIAGGYGGGFDLREWVADVLANTEAVILIGASADQLAQELRAHPNAVRAATPDEAGSIAARLARPGSVVLLSPAHQKLDIV